MSPFGTKREFSPERLKGRRLPHCRRSYLNVVYPAVTTPEFRPARARAFDPKRPFTLGMVVVCNADKTDLDRNKHDGR
jgi:hypothetical protein